MGELGTEHFLTIHAMEKEIVSSSSIWFWIGVAFLVYALVIGLLSKEKPMAQKVKDPPDEDCFLVFMNFYLDSKKTIADVHKVIRNNGLFLGKVEYLEVTDKKRICFYLLKDSSSLVITESLIIPGEISFSRTLKKEES